MELSPADALDAVAYRLETEGAPTYKVRAFRRAAASVRAVDAEALARLWRSGRLTDLPGVGEATAKVVAEALAGEWPSYLAALEARREAPPSGAAGELRAALAGDCHLHSDWSDGGSPIEVMARAAAGLGHRYAVLTDHSPRLTIAHGLERERLLRQLDVVAALNEELALDDELAPFRLLTGIEVDILEDGTLDQEDELLARLDVVVASVHSKLRMAASEMTPRLIRAVTNPLVDILGHCTGRIVVGRGRPPSEFDADEVFAACAASGTAVEINCRPERQDPPDDLLQRARAAGCVFSIDSDAHAPGQLEWQVLGCERAVAAGIDAGRVVNCLTAEQLRAWTADKPHGIEPARR